RGKIGRIRAVIPAGASGPVFMSATGGTVTTDGDYKVHTFTSNGTFTVTALGSDPTYGSKVWRLIQAGGGAGGWSGTNNSDAGAGGGAGGYLNNNAYDHSVLVQAYPVVVGAGGIATSSSATNGGDSSFDGDTATGGGAGAGGPASPFPARNGSNGGSG